MPTVNKSALVPYSAEQMFELVNDIESYPVFLPWCRSARVLAREGDEVHATIEIAKGRVRKTFETRNRLQRPERIELRLVEGPFSRLHGVWLFQPLRGDACKVSLDLEFDFSSLLMRATVGPVFNRIADTMVDSFCKRADRVYA